MVFNLAGNILPVGFATGTAEIITTLFFGLFIYLAFIEIEIFGGEKKLPTARLARIGLNAGKYTKEISSSLIKLIFKDSPRLLKEITRNVRDTWKSVSVLRPRYQGDLFLAGCLVYLLEGKHEQLGGPFSSIWLEAWRQANPNQLGPNATAEEIAEFANSYRPDQLPKVSQNVESKFYELLESTYENADGDEWSTELMEAQNHPVSDAILLNEQTGQGFEINYKFSENSTYIESHIGKHPGVPVIAPPDVAEKIDSPYVIAGNYDYDFVSEVNDGNFEKLLNEKFSEMDPVINDSDFNKSLDEQPVGMGPGIAAAGTLEFGSRVLPFVFAYYRNKITKKQFSDAILKIFPSVTARTVNRIAMLTLLGPVYGMYLLASLSLKGTLTDFNDEEIIETEGDEKEEAGPPKKPTKKGFTRRELLTLSYLAILK